MPLDRGDVILSARFPVLDEGGVGAVKVATRGRDDRAIGTAPPDLAGYRGDYDGGACAPCCSIGAGPYSYFVMQATTS